MTTITRDFDHILRAIKGFVAEGALDKAVIVNADSIPYAISGRVGYLDTNGLWNSGPPTRPTDAAMPLFLLDSYNDLDVSNGAHDPDGAAIWVNTGPSGVLNALVATGGFELQTTEFDGEQTYAPNDPLTADSEGVLTNYGAVLYGSWIVGLCSTHEHSDWQTKGTSVLETSPTGINANGKSVLTFWSYYLPAIGML